MGAPVPSLCSYFVHSSPLCPTSPLSPLPPLAFLNGIFIVAEFCTVD